MVSFKTSDHLKAQAVLKHFNAKWTGSTQQTCFSRVARLGGCLKTGKQYFLDKGKDLQDRTNYVTKIRKCILKWTASRDRKRSQVSKVLLCRNNWSTRNKTLALRDKQNGTTVNTAVNQHVVPKWAILSTQKSHMSSRNSQSLSLLGEKNINPQYLWFIHCFTWGKGKSSKWKPQTTSLESISNCQA